MTLTESSESSEELLSQDGDVSSKAGNRKIVEVFKETVMMFCCDSLEGTAMMFPCCTCTFFGRPPFPLFFRFFGPLFLGKKEVILVLLVNLEEGDMTFKLMIG